MIHAWDLHAYTVKIAVGWTMLFLHLDENIQGPGAKDPVSLAMSLVHGFPCKQIMGMQVVKFMHVLITSANFTCISVANPEEFTLHMQFAGRHHRVSI